MEFKIKRKEFLEGLSLVQGVVEKKNTMPILSNVLLEADKVGIKISATDLEVAVSCNIVATVSKPGKITVLARSIQDIVRESEHEEIKFVLGDNDRIELSAGSAVFKIPGLNASEFPSFPTVDSQTVDINCDVLKQMIEKTSFSMANDETRYNLNGVLLQKKGEGLVRMVATDGHRLALTEKELNLGGKDVSVIIPRKGVGELKKMLAHEGNFELAVGTKGLLAKRGSETLYIRYLDGDFPDYTTAIPQENNVIASVPKAGFVGALRRVSLLSNERSRGVVLSFTPGHLEVSAANPDLGEAREEISIDYKGPKMNIGFNARYLLDVVDVLKDEKVLIALRNETSASLIKSEFDPGFMCVIMPMRI